MPEGFQRIWDEQIWLHRVAAPITVTQDGEVEPDTPPKTHVTGPGMFAAATYLLINVTSADDTDGNETYQVEWKAQRLAGGYQTFAIFPIPRGTANRVFEVPISNRWWDNTAYDEVKVTLTLGGTTPSLDCTIRISVTMI